MDAGKLIGYIITALSILLILGALSIILAPYAGWHVDSVLSGSMEPTIHTGSIVFIRPVSTDQIHVGDVIAFTNGNVGVCHRVVSIEGTTPPSFITKGDANNGQDPSPVSASRVTGIVVLSIPFAGYVSNFVRTPIGVILLILIPALYLIGSELKSMVFDRDEGEKRDRK